MSIELFKRILILSFSIKILILIALTLINSGDIGGYNNNSIKSDDFRYVSGAIYYSENAKSLIDKEVFTHAFSRLGDYTGYSTNFSLWYWLLCIGAYLFKSIFVLRVMNILFSILTAYYIYKLCLLLFNKKSANFALIIYSFNPYFVIFPLFLYKDQLITLLMVQLFYFLYSYFISNKKHYLIYLLLVLVLFSFLRTGFVFLLGAAILVLFLIREKQFLNYTNFSKSKNFIYIFGISILLIYTLPFFLVNNFEIIQKKLVAYIIERQISSSDTISLFQISAISDIYKLPFTFVFALLQPVNLTSQISSVSGFVGIINLFGVFLAVGNCLALFDKRIRNLNFTWIINALFIITLISSLGISRHYYFMLPFYVIFLSVFITKKNNLKIALYCSMLLYFFVCLYYLIKII